MIEEVKVNQQCVKTALVVLVIVTINILHDFVHDVLSCDSIFELLLKALQMSMETPSEIALLLQISSESPNASALVRHI